jgi:outer membrane protein TolC
MKKLYAFTFLFFALLSFKASAQESIIDQVNYPLLQKYIQSAKEHFTQKKIFAARTESAKTAISLNTISYLDILNASYFYRPNSNYVLTVPGVANANPYSVNGFQFGASVNIGQFLEKPSMVKRAKADYNIAKLQEDEYDTTLAMEVKRRYYDYIQQISLLKVYTQGAQDSKGIAEGLKNKFAKGEITIDAYNLSRINEAASVTAKIQAETNYLKAKDLLEEIIGVKLSEIN